MFGTQDVEECSWLPWLSLGFQSRKETCYPKVLVKNPTDFPSQVIGLKS